jgi:nucleoside-diphosphate-sugar epimerase
MRVTIIGANGFVGAAFSRYLSGLGLETLKVTRDNYKELIGTASDVVIEASGNSKKYLAEQEPVNEFGASVLHRMRSLHDFPAEVHIQISSVDVYSQLDSASFTMEDAPIEIEKLSNYGFHKLLAEQIVRRYAPKWIILRLSGMLGPGLKKNPVYDIVNNLPLRIHPDSKYQFIATDRVAEIAWDLYLNRHINKIFNICGEGTVSPRQIAREAGFRLNLKLIPSTLLPRNVDININKISALYTIPRSSETVKAFLESVKKTSLVSGTGRPCS